jgi:tetratricopeptide (TPR) repeat protein
MDVKLDQRPDSHLLAVVAAVVGVLLLAALLLRMGGLLESAHRDVFAVDVAKSVAGNSGHVANGVAAGVNQPETERLSGMLALKNGDTGQANELFQSVMEENESMVPLVRWARPNDETLARFAYGLYPSIPDSPAWLAGILVAKQPEEALKLYLEAAALDPIDNLRWEQIGVLAQQLKHNDIALDAFGKACAIFPRRYGNCIKAAQLSYNAGSWEQVIQYFELGSMPRTPPDWVLLIKAAQKLGRSADADSYLAQAEAAAPADYTALLADQP